MRKNSKTRLIEFTTNVKEKRYTRCELGNIVGSDSCKACIHHKGKIAENIKSPDGRFIHNGIVECDFNDKIR